MNALVDHNQFTAPHLLPMNATDFEREMALTMARISDVPVPIDRLMDAEKSPSDFLPWLAWALSVDIWDEDWSEEKKRATIRRSINLHRIKGTLAGIRAYIEIAGGELYSYVRPPSKSFLGASVTRAEREAFLDKLPQVRIYTSRRRGQANKRAFFGRQNKPSLYGSFDADLSGRAVQTPAISDVADRLRKRAIYRHEGLDRELTWSRADHLGERVYLKGQNRRGVFCGMPINRHFVKSTASNRIVTLDLDRTTPSDRVLYRFPVVPKLKPVHASPQRIYERGTAGKSVFCGVPMAGRYFMRSGARYRIYDAIHLRLPDQQIKGRQAISFMGLERFGMPAFCAELAISIKGRRSKWIADRFVGGSFYKAPQKVLAQNMAAVRASKSYRDEIHINTKTYRPLSVGSPLYIGAPLIIGAMTRT